MATPMRHTGSDLLPNEESQADRCTAFALLPTWFALDVIRLLRSCLWCCHMQSIPATSPPGISTLMTSPQIITHHHAFL